MTSDVDLGAHSADRSPPPTADDPTSPVRRARTAGLLYLVLAVFGGFAEIVRTQVYVPGDATATATNLAAHPSLVRLSVVADLVQALVWLVLALVLYRLFEHVSRDLARAMVVFVVVSVGITSLNMVHQLVALLVATDPRYAAAIGVGGSNTLALLLMDLHHYGYLISQLSWLWLLVLGVLGYRSGMFPRPLALLLMLGTFCYVTDTLTQFLAPALGHATTPFLIVPEIVSELALLAYLLVTGVRTPSPGHRTA